HAHVPAQPRISRRGRRAALFAQRPGNAGLRRSHRVAQSADRTPGALRRSTDAVPASRRGAAATDHGQQTEARQLTTNNGRPDDGRKPWSWLNSDLSSVRLWFVVRDIDSRWRSDSRLHQKERAMRMLHTMLRVNDLEESLRFYCDHLGMR